MVASRSRAAFALRGPGIASSPTFEKAKSCSAPAAKPPHQQGDLVVALVDGAATVRWLLPVADGTWFLRPSNPACPDTALRNLDRIQAVVVDYLAGQPRYGAAPI